jgi:hypothetical protein
VQTIAWVDGTSEFWDEDQTHRDRSSHDRLCLEQLALSLPTSVERSVTATLDATRILRLITHSLQLELNSGTVIPAQVDHADRDVVASPNTHNPQPASSRLRVPDSEVAALYRNETGANLSRDTWFIKAWLTEAARGRRVFATK